MLNALSAHEIAIFWLKYLFVLLKILFFRYLISFILELQHDDYTTEFDNITE